MQEEIYSSEEESELHALKTPSIYISCRVKIFGETAGFSLCSAPEETCSIEFEDRFSGNLFI